MSDKNCYSVLYAQTVKQEKVAEMIRRNIPDGKGTVFCPGAEYWMNGSDKYIIRPLFPGYIFIRSTLDKLELRKIVKDSSAKINTYVKNLSKVAAQDTDEYGRIFDFSDDEARFLDFLLSFKCREDEEEHPGQDCNITSDGIIRMSRGYEKEKGTYVVVDGPLKGLEQYIVNVNKRDRKAYLNLEVAGHRARAGLEIYAKKYFFPDEDGKTDMLESGQEIDIDKIAYNMMRGR